tara:strand:- start:57 stop:599 length:543 start_codon:yes stop_codon:yes gene_type:complete
MCRSDINNRDDIQVIGENDDDDNDEDDEKIDELIKDLPNHLDFFKEFDKKKNFKFLLEYIKDLEPNAKIIIGCSTSTTEPFTSMKQILDEKQYSVNEIKGHSTTIGRIVESYKTENGLDAILLNTQYKASGINLENTTDIILYHKMDIDTERQIIGRGQRYGRTQPLRIWKLYSQNEMSK